MDVYINVIVLFAILSVVSTYVTPKNKFEEGVLNIIDKVKTGDSGSLPLPFTDLSLSPLSIPPTTNTDEGNTLYIGEGHVYGLEEMSVDKISTFESWILIELFVPQLKVRADYTLQSEPIFSYRILDDEGSFSCDIFNLKMWVDVQFGTRNGNTVIPYLKIYYVFSDVLVNLSNSWKIVNEKVRKKILTLLFNHNTKKIIQRTIKKEARRYLQGRTFQDFKDIISSV